MKRIITGSVLAIAALSQAYAATVTMSDAETGKVAGTIEINESAYGLVFTPSLSGMTPGGHGFHVHENPSCDSKMKQGETVPAGAAGSHYDPDNTDNHGYPWTDDSHLGDLPLLYVGAQGKATHPVLAPRIRSVSDIEGRAVMIHAGGDNYADSPKKLGGGGARVLCGVIAADN